MFSQNRAYFDYAVTRRGGTNDQSYLSRRLADGSITRSVIEQARVSRALADRRESDLHVARTNEGARRFGDVTALIPVRRSLSSRVPPPGLPPPGSTPPGRQIGEALGPLSGILGSAAGGAAALGEAALIGGVAAAPVLAAGAAVTGVGYGVYRLGESLHLW